MKTFFKSLVVFLVIQLQIPMLFAGEIWRPASYEYLDEKDKALIAGMTPVTNQNVLIIDLLLDSSHFEDCEITVYKTARVRVLRIDHKPTNQTVYVNMPMGKALLTEYAVYEDPEPAHWVVADSSPSVLESDDISSYSNTLKFYLSINGALVRKLEVSSVKNTTYRGVTMGLWGTLKFRDPVETGPQFNCVESR